MDYKRNHSNVWFLKHIATGIEIFLNVGKLKIGREQGNDIQIDRFIDHLNICADIHCIITLDNNRVWLWNSVSSIYCSFISKNQSKWIAKEYYLICLFIFAVIKRHFCKLYENWAWRAVCRRYHIIGWQTKIAQIV